MVVAGTVGGHRAGRREPVRSDEAGDGGPPADEPSGFRGVARGAPAFGQVPHRAPASTVEAVPAYRGVVELTQERVPDPAPAEVPGEPLAVGVDPFPALVEEEDVVRGHVSDRDERDR